ncbi:MAG: hypothetical protein GQ546_14320 [Gammaproteobacteria bacterium]|nr:hypothetical protein [Gammaproteobacteria bacterium]
MSQFNSYLPKRLSDSEFSTLRAEMLENVQVMSGNLWTDYNLHDPGITILEQLCYALTDINYRSEYTIEDLLVNTDETIDLHQHGLFTTDEALPNRPITTMDYQKYLIDRVDEIAYVYLTPARISENSVQLILCGCLFDVYITQKQNMFGHKDCSTPEAIKKRVKNAFNQVRNLGEDINRIVFIEEKKVDLVATIEIDDRPSIPILADIYFNIGKSISGTIDKKTMQTDSADEYLLADKLTGPLLISGFLDDKDIENKSKKISISSLVSILKNTSGITKIKSISFETESGEIFSDCLASIREMSHSLVIPSRQEDIKVRLLNNGKNVETNIVEFVNAYEMLVHNNYHQQKAMGLKPAPGVYPHKKKSLTSYCSVQSQFPNVYGINQLGIPPSFSTERKAQAMQLKGYMLLFDQIMADHLAMLDNTQDLFSINLEAKSSYKTQALQKDAIADIEKLYKNIPDSEFLTSNNHYENFPERKGRVFDYLLAINGRDKQQYGFEYKNPYFIDEELTENILTSKSLNLQNIHNLAANRSAGFDYSRQSWGTDNVSIIQQTISTLLGIDTNCRSLIEPLLTQGFYFSEEENNGSIYSSSAVNANAPLTDSEDIIYIDITADEIAEQSDSFKPVPYLKFDHEKTGIYLSAVKNRLTDEDGTLNKIIFIKGIDLQRYRVAQVHDESSVELFFNSTDDPDLPANWNYLASFKKQQDAFAAANSIRESLVAINLEMEGLHLIEHNLLLPVDEIGCKRIDKNTIKNFYAFQISILLPDWTARFRDSDFRLYVEKLIREECPAHIYANIHWLNISTMKDFESIFKNWLRYKKENTGFEKLNVQSERLTEFLQLLASTESKD